jgi:hypothetical protein
MEIKIKPGALVVGLGLAGLWATKPSQASFQSYLQSWLKEQIGTAKKSEKKYVGGDGLDTDCGVLHQTFLVLMCKLRRQKWIFCQLGIKNRRHDQFFGIQCS